MVAVALLALLLIALVAIGLLGRAHQPPRLGAGPQPRPIR